jgi:hypothetical protein
MITLYTFGPYFGLPDGSPFVIKVMLLLKFAGLEYREDRGGYRQGAKRQAALYQCDGLIVADSTFVRFHIEKKYVGAEGSRLGGRENVRGTPLFCFVGDALVQ